MSESKEFSFELEPWVEKCLQWMNTVDMSYSQVEDQLRTNGLKPKEIHYVIQMVKERRQKKAKGNRRASLFWGLGLLIFGLLSPILTLAIGLSEDMAITIAGGMGAVGVLTLITRGRK